MIISLMGFMGCGKTTLGEILAKKLNYRFIDLDTEIEKYTNNSIENIFIDKGENYFRDIESNILNDIINNNLKNNIILSLGGGTPCFKDNIKIIKNKTISIYLKVNSNILLDRISKSQRPLIKGKTIQEINIFINKYTKKRSKFYNQADINILSNNNISYNIAKITHHLKKFVHR